ncbi:MAG TPA: hypothetical protein VGJ03_03210 [Acidimicrobiales bacterium]
MASELDRILDPTYIGDVRALAMKDVRSMRSECQEVETGLSYLRRLVQGRLDIVGVETLRRREGGEPGELSVLVSQLPEILAAGTRAPGVGRLPQLLAPGELDADLEARFESVVAGHDVESLSELSDDSLEQLHDQLEAFEHEVSGFRRQLFDRIDALQAEITRRYRTGEASVETLLQ